MLYLYTGHRSCRLLVPPKYYYHGDYAGMDKLVATLPDFARSYGLGYVLLTPADYGDMGAGGLAQAVQSAALQPLYKTDGAAIYRVKPVTDAAAEHPASNPLAYNHSK